MTPYYAFAGTFTTAGTSPDGDTIHFRPDHPANLAAIGALPPRPPNWPRASARGLTTTIRLEALDAPELHYQGSRQRRATIAKAILLTRLGLSTGESRGWVVARQVDIYRRVIGFVYRNTDLAVTRDGSIGLDRKAILASANADMLATGAAYHLAYATLARPLRTHLQELATVARRDRRGVWASDSTAAFQFRALSSVCERGALVFPKLFRRCVTFCRESASRFVASDFVHWLQRAPGHDDWVEVNGKRHRMSALLSSLRDRVRVEVDPLDIVFVPKG